MIIIGEKLNSSIPKTLEAINKQDFAYIVDLINRQTASGAEYLDINTALSGENEINNMLKLIDLALENSACGIMIDSPNPNVIIHCVPKIENRKTIINSITLDEKYDALIEIAKQYDTGLVCLPMKGNSIPSTAEERFQNAQEIINKLRCAEIQDENIYIDILVEAIATNENAAVVALKTIMLIKENFPKINTICGLSNISFGLPNRAKLNSAFLAMAMQNGLDSAIVDIISEDIKNALFASNALIGKDEYCIEYINYSRQLHS